MGKSSKPLSIRIDGDMVDWPEIQELIAKGHCIKVIEDEDIDLILSRKAWRMMEMLRKYLPLSILTCRKEKYGDGKKASPKGE